MLVNNPQLDDLQSSLSRTSTRMPMAIDRSGPSYSVKATPRQVVNVAVKVADRPAGSGLTEHLSGVFVDGFILKELFFSLEPVVQFRTGLITSLDVEFVGPSPDLFFG